jgi:hypothetical protein
VPPPSWESASWAELVAPDGRGIRVPAGGIIGRMASAALCLRDPRVSEAHALVTLRGRELKLLALRRWFEVDGERASEARLCPGQRIGLAPGCVLEVRDVRVAEAVLALTGCGPRPLQLEAPVYSLVQRSEGLALVAGFEEPALGHLWSTGSGWAAQIGGEPADLRPGLELQVVGHKLGIVALPCPEPAPTAQDGYDPPLKIVLRHDTVHVHREGRPPAIINGVPARILCEVALLGAPVPWEVAASEVYPSEPDRRVLRQNWDRNLRTLRARLRDHALRPDLVRPDGKGNVELLLMPGDELVDETT